MTDKNEDPRLIDLRLSDLRRLVREEVERIEGARKAPDGYIDSSEAAKLLSLHPSQVIRLAREGKIPARMVGKRWRFLVSELVEAAS